MVITSSFSPNPFLVESPGEPRKLWQPAPEIPKGNNLVPYGTPLHVVDTTLLLLKLTFADLPENHPYHYTNDYNKTGVLFDVNLNKGGDIWGKKPLVIISRGNQQSGVTSLGDMATSNIPMEAHRGSNMVEANLDIKVISKSKAECEIISQIVFSTLLVCRTILPRLCGIHMASGVTLSPVSKFELDDEMFLGQLMLQFSMQYSWAVTTPVHLLKSISTHVNRKPGHEINTSEPSDNIY